MKRGGLPETSATLAALVHARDALKGVRRPNADTHLVLSLLLLKIASDAIPIRTASMVPPSLDPPRRVPYGVPAHVRFETLFRQRHAPGNGPRLMNALRVFTLANPRKLGGLFPALELLDALPGDEAACDVVLRHLLERLSLPALDFRHPRAGTHQLVGDAVEGLLERSAAGHSRPESGQLPPTLAWLMSALMRPRADEAVYDPHCGQGALLVAASCWARDQVGLDASRSAFRYPPYGQEPDPLPCAVARLRLLLHGTDTPHLRARDALEDPLVESGQLQRFHVALACPPLHLKWVPTRASNDPYLRFLQGTAPRQWAHAALIQHMLATLDPQHGRMAIVVPHGVLFRDGEEARIRLAWLDANLVETVIGLPDRLFGGASVATALLVLRNARADDAVLFIDAKALATPGRRGPRLRSETAACVQQLCEERRSVPGVAYLATAEDIAGNNGNLSIARYVQPAAAPAAADLGTLRKRRIALAATFTAIHEALNAELDALEREFSDLL